MQVCHAFFVNVVTPKQLSSIQDHHRPPGKATVVYTQAHVRHVHSKRLITTRWRGDALAKYCTFVCHAQPCVCYLLIFLLGPLDYQKNYKQSHDCVELGAVKACVNNPKRAGGRPGYRMSCVEMNHIMYPNSIPFCTDSFKVQRSWPRCWRTQIIMQCAPRARPSRKRLYIRRPSFSSGDYIVATRVPTLPVCWNHIRILHSSWDRPTEFSALHNMLCWSWDSTCRSA